MLSHLSKTSLAQSVSLAVGKKRLFPSIFRIIPESLNLSGYHIAVFKISALIVISVYLMLASLSQSRLLSDNRIYLESLRQNRLALEKQASFWKGITQKYEKYPDAYLKLAQIEYQLGNATVSRELVDKALVLNPELRQSAVLGEFVARISE